MNIKNILKKYSKDKSYLLEIMHDVEESKENKYLSLNDLKVISKYLNINLSAAYGAATFYSMFSLKPQAKYIIKICSSTVCHIKKSYNILSFLKSLLNCDDENLSKDGLFAVSEVECLGLCDISPSMMINNQVYGDLDENSIKRIVEELKNGSSSA